MKKKSDDHLQTGTSGGNNSIYTDVDEAVLDIIGRDLPSIKGIEGSESWDPVKSIDNCETNINVTTDETFKNKQGASFSTYHRKRSTELEIKDVKMKRRKTELQTDALHLQKTNLQLPNYKLTLEIYRFENELGFDHQVTNPMIQMGMEDLFYTQL
uniref:Uncharacterized protein n=1 Tax=Romanomermis culicivorax TaxID=13658 RepID=A0A915KBL1_ROMCU